MTIIIKKETFASYNIDFCSRYWNYANNCFAPFSFSLLCFASTMIGTLEYEIILVSTICNSHIFYKIEEKPSDSF